MDGKATIDVGDGEDTVNTGVQDALATTVQRNLTILGRAGHDDFQIANTTLSGKATIDAGDGNNTVVINEVQGTSYPYFYVVLVARKGYGLRDAYRGHKPGDDVTKEFKYEGGVEVMVLRQHTTERSGYHTKPAVANSVFYEGLDLAEEVAVKAAV